MKRKHVKEDSSENLPLLIKAYGEFWDPEATSWEKYELWGSLRPNSEKDPINVYYQRGVYVLYKNFLPVYVGRAFGQPIGLRVEGHRKSPRKGPRWDRFSWFGISHIAENGELGDYTGPVNCSPENLVATLEALLILAVVPSMNMRRETFRNAKRVYQSNKDKPAGVSERLGAIEKQLGLLLKNRSK